MTWRVMSTRPCATAAPDAAAVDAAKAAAAAQGAVVKSLKDAKKAGGDVSKVRPGR
jgi:hypothetical protein